LVVAILPVAVVALLPVAVATAAVKGVEVPPLRHPLAAEEAMVRVWRPRVAVVGVEATSLRHHQAGLAMVALLPVEAAVAVKGRAALVAIAAVSPL
jgi:hypothetical protein